MKRIKLFSLLLSFGLLLSACSSSQTEDKKSVLLEKKKELATLKSEIKTLETELSLLEPETKKQGTIVFVSTLEAEDFSHSFEVNASLTPVQSALISPEMSGQLKKLLVKEGDKVTKGQVLAQLNTKIIESGIEEIQVALDLANQMFKRQENLWNQEIGSEIDFLTAKNGKASLEAKLNSLQTQLEMATITSPIDGVVDQMHIEAGEMAMPGMTMMQIINLDEFYLRADVAETHLASLKLGDPVEISFPSFPELNKKSKISRLGNIINPENRSFITEVKLVNTYGKLKPNMLALTRFIDFEANDAIVVPTSLVKKDFNGAYLYIANQKGEDYFAKKAYVETGYTSSNKTHILSGLELGQQIIIEGFDKVVDGTKLQIK